MKKFIKHIISFFVFVGLFTAFSLFVFMLIVNKKAKEFNIDSSIEKVFIGDSHIQKDINDALIGKAINIGERAEATFYSYYKLKYLLKNNPNIKEVYLGFSYHNISNYYDPFVKGEYSLTTAPKYYYLLPNKTKFSLLLDNYYHVSFYKSVVKVGFDILKGKEKPYKGKYLNKYSNTHADKKIMDKRLKFQYYDANGEINGFSNISIEYLKKIQLLCKEYKVEFYVLNTPLHAYYKSKVPIKFIDKYNTVLKENRMQELFYGTLIFEEKDFIPDGDHLSTEGAVVFSNYLQGK
ncbi:MAG: hypothetical protein H6578_09275 [Chitinophagales bacterium]|nr:hypothetical protein [Chitinophagales bacterium]